MKKIRKVLAIVLAAIMVMMTVAVPVFASDRDLDPSADSSSRFKAILYSIVDKIISFALKILNAVIPGRDWGKTWPAVSEYGSDGFYEGGAFGEADENAAWSMGYSKASLLQGIDPMDGSYYLGGSLEAINGRVPTAVIDDQQVVVYALSDGSKTVVHAIIDCFGIARGDVVAIRKDLASWAEENGVDAIQISALHQHSCIDTLGLSAPLVEALLFNPPLSLFGSDISKYVQGKNATFMSNVYKYTEYCIKDAFANMTEGELSFGYADASDLIYDKRTPDNTNDNAYRFRFVPEDASANEIWLVNINCHDVTFGASADVLSADYPYYVREQLAARNIDCAYVQGAELAITTESQGIADYGELTTDKERAVAFASAFVAKLDSVSNDVVLDPVLNFAAKEVTIAADNGVLALAVREGLITPVIAKDGSDLCIITEIGYMELGGRVGVFFAPGELDPQIVWGTATGDKLTSAQSWNGSTWDKTPIAETADIGDILCFGLANDQIGYVLCSSDVRSILTENEEVLASSYAAAAKIVEAFEALVAEVK